MAKKKKNSNENEKTTARIPSLLQRVVKKRCIDLSTTQTDAINQGLELWLAYHSSEPRLKNQIDILVRTVRSRVESEGHTVNSGDSSVSNKEKFG